MSCLTLSQAITDFEAHETLRGMSPRTIKARRNGLLDLGRFWGDRDLRELTAVDFERYSAHVLARLKRNSAYHYLASVRLLFRHLANRRLVLIDPTADLPMPNVHEGPLGRILTSAEIDRLLSFTVVTPGDIRNRAMLEFLYSTGLRADEMLKVKVGDIASDSVSVRSGKGGRGRVVPLGKQARAWLDRYLAEARPTLAKPDVEELWVSSWGHGFCHAWLAKTVRELGRRAGIQGVTCHTMRRTLATHMIANGAGEEAVSAILGHADLGSISRYARIAARDVRRTHESHHPREGS